MRSILPDPSDSFHVVAGHANTLPRLDSSENALSPAIRGKTGRTQASTSGRRRGSGGRLEALPAAGNAAREPDDASGVTPQHWAALTPYQQQQHITYYGPPPASWPTHPQALAPMYAAPWPTQPPYAAPIVNVAVSQNMVAGQRPIAHGLHLVLTLLTGGLWAFVWIAIVIFRR